MCRNFAEDHNGILVLSVTVGERLWGVYYGSILWSLYYVSHSKIRRVYLHVFMHTKNHI